MCITCNDQQAEIKKGSFAITSRLHIANIPLF